MKNQGLRKENKADLSIKAYNIFHKKFNMGINIKPL